jgi:hypothetical protein
MIKAKRETIFLRRSCDCDGRKRVCPYCSERNKKMKGKSRNQLDQQLVAFVYKNLDDSSVSEDKAKRVILDLWQACDRHSAISLCEHDRSMILVTKDGSNDISFDRIENLAIVTTGESRKLDMLSKDERLEEFDSIRIVKNHRKFC